MTLLSLVLALALTAVLAACGSEEPSGGIASTPGSGDAPTATDAPGPAAATAPPAASGSIETDREALVALYNATDGENWKGNANWLSDAPLGRWRGVTTNDDGRVTKLLFIGNNIGGEIPPELGRLSNLTHLLLGGGGLSGELPAELGSLSNLTVLRLNDNGLSGEIPAELGRLTNLRTLELARNRFSGEIPPELGRLTNLTRLELAGNHQLSGCVPSSLEDRLVVSYFGDLVAFC